MDVRQSTAAYLLSHPVIENNATAGRYTGSFTSGDWLLCKGATPAAPNASFACAHVASGQFSLVLTASDTNTRGPCKLVLNSTGYDTLGVEFNVLSQAAYDALYGTGVLDVNVTQISGDSAAADNLEAILDGTGGVTLGYFLISGAAAGQHGLTITGGSGMDGLRLVGGGIGGWSLNVADYIYTGVGIYGGAVELFQTIAARTLLASQYGTSTNQATILARIGAFLGTGTNTIYGWLRSLLRKDVAAPSDIGGTYDPATDSLEAIRDYAGSGTSVLTTDDLDAMATQLIADLATAHGSGAWGSTSVSISTTEQTIQTGD